jgi:hypothetical protein
MSAESLQFSPYSAETVRSPDAPEHGLPALYIPTDMSRAHDLAAHELEVAADRRRRSMRHDAYPGQVRREAALGTKMALAVAALALTVVSCGTIEKNPLKPPPPHTYGPKPPTSCQVHTYIIGRNTVHITAIGEFSHVTYRLGRRNAKDNSLVDFLDPPHEVIGKDGTDIKNVPSGPWVGTAVADGEACTNGKGFYVS